MGRLSAMTGTEGHIAALGAAELRPAWFVEFDFKSGIERFWTGTSDISWDGHTWVGTGLFADFVLPGEGEELEAREFVFTMGGVSRDYYSVAVNTNYSGRPVKVWFNLLNTVHNAVEYAWLIEQARMDILRVEPEEKTIRLILTAESRLIDMFRPNRVNWTTADHVLVHPGDLFFNFVPRIPNTKLPWGLEGAASGRVTSGAGGPAGGYEANRRKP